MCYYHITSNMEGYYFFIVIINFTLLENRLIFLLAPHL